MQLRRLLLQSVFWRGAYFLSVLLLNVCVARYFGSEGSASIYFATTVFSFICLFSGLSLESGLGYFAAQNTRMIAGMTALGVYWSALVTVFSFILFCFVPAVLPVLAGDFHLSFFAGLSFISSTLLTGYVSAIFYARNNFLVPNLIGVVCNLLQIILLIISGFEIVPFLHSGNCLYYYFGMYVVQALSLLVAVYKKENVKNVFQLPSREELRKIIGYSFTAYFANMLFMLLYRADYWFVDRFRSAAELGNYIQVSKLSQMLVLVPSFLATALFPAVAGGRKEEVLRELTVLSRLSLILIGIPCILIAAAGYFIFPLLFGRSFDRMALPFLLLVPGILSLSTLYPLSAYYAGKNRVRVNLFGSLLGLIFIVIADLIFVPRFGIAAAALVSSIGYMLFHAYVLFTFKGEYTIPVRDFFIIRQTDLVWIRTQILNLVYRKA